MVKILTSPVQGDVPFGGHKATGLADPSSAQDAATKAYVDAVAQGLSVKASVRAASTANIASQSGLLTVDGVTLVDGDRVLAKDQTTGSTNGIWVAHSGAWTRAADGDVGAELVGAFVFVEEGTTNAGSGWVQTAAAPITVGTTSLTWVQFSGAGQIVAGAGLAKAGNTLRRTASATGYANLAALPSAAANNGLLERTADGGIYESDGSAWQIVRDPSGTYVQPSNGLTYATVKPRLAFFDPSDPYYGGVGNGVADDTAALAAAWADAISHGNSQLALRPGTRWVTSQPLALNATDATTSAVINGPTIVGLGGAPSRIGDSPWGASNNSPAEIVASGTFPVGQYLIDITSNIAPVGGTTIRDIGLRCASRAAGIRLMGHRKALIQNVAVDVPTTAPNPTIVSTLAQATPASAAIQLAFNNSFSSSAYSVIDNCSVHGGLDGIGISSNCTSLVRNCFVLAVSRYGFYVGAFSNLYGSQADQSAVADVYLVADHTTLSGEFQFAGGLQACIILAAVLNPYPGSQGGIIGARIIGGGFGSMAGTGRFGEPGTASPIVKAVQTLSATNQDQSWVQAIFSGCEFASAPATNYWFQADPGLIGSVVFGDDCMFTGVPTVAPYKRNGFPGLRFGATAPAQTAMPFSSAVGITEPLVPAVAQAAPTTAAVTPNGTTGATAYTYQVTTTDQFGESAPVIVGISNGNAALGWSNPAGNLATGASVDFEDGTVGIWAALTNASIANSTAQAYQGTHSMIVTATATVGAQYDLARYDIAVTAQTYSTGIWVYVPAGNSCGIKMQVSSPGQGTITGTTVAAAGGGWTFCSVTFTPVSSGTAHIYVMTAGASTTGNVVYVDAFSLVTGSTAANGTASNTITWDLSAVNMLASPSFEDGSLGPLTAVAAVTLVNDTTYVYEGTKAVKGTYVSDQGTHAVLAKIDKTNLTVGTPHTFSCWVYVPAGNSGNVVVGTLPAGVTTWTYSLHKAVPGGGWTRLVITGTPTSTGTSSFWIYADAGTSTAGQSFWVDAVQLSQLGATPFARIGWNVYGRVAGSVGLLASVKSPTYTDLGAVSPGAAPPSVGSTVPASGAAYTNPYPFAVNVIVTGGTVTGIARNGVSLGVTSGSVRLRVGDTITLTYSAVPTWTWLAA